MSGARSGSVGACNSRSVPTSPSPHNANKGRFREASFDGSITDPELMMGAGSFTFRTDCPL